MTEYREFWSDNTETIYEELSTSAEGLTSDEVQKRLLKYGLNNIKSKKERERNFPFISFTVQKPYHTYFALCNITVSLCPRNN